MALGETCECGRIHGLGSVAVGRFQPGGPLGYRARSFASAPMRQSRGEALADECRLWRGDGL